MAFNFWLSSSRVLAVAIVAATCNLALAQPASNDSTPLLVNLQRLTQDFCTDCHSGNITEANIDLGVIYTLDAIRNDLPTWQSILRVVVEGQMPPVDSPQPTAEFRQLCYSGLSELLKAEAQLRAGDPGQIPLRRLNTAELTYSVRDLTGVDSLNPFADFPTDGAAGEGFTNAAAALSMSPALYDKLLVATRRIAEHAVLLPDGIQFSEFTTRRDLTNNLLNQIRDLYAKYTRHSGSTQVDLQGIRFDTNVGGRLPIEVYLKCLLENQHALAADPSQTHSLAVAQQLSPRYLARLWKTLNHDPGILFQQLRTLTIQSPSDIPVEQKVQAAIKLISQWQTSLWQFATVGHIGKVGGPPGWMVPVAPLMESQHIEFPLTGISTADTLHTEFDASWTPIEIDLVCSAAGDGSEDDKSIWKSPRLRLAAGQEIPLKLVPELLADLERHQSLVIGSTANCLAAIDEFLTDSMKPNTDTRIDDLAISHGVKSEALLAWLNVLGIHASRADSVGALLTNSSSNIGSYESVSGWTASDALSVVANRSSDLLRIPGKIAGHSVAVHPSPSQRVGIAWRAPMNMIVNVQGNVEHAHPECGNGVAWTLCLRHGSIEQILGSGEARGAGRKELPKLNSLTVRNGDYLALLVDSRERNHSCDLTAVNLEITSDDFTWSLSPDVADNILAKNPLSDKYGNDSIWHFFSEPATAENPRLQIGNDSLLAKWLSANSSQEKSQYADALQNLLTSDSVDSHSADDVLLREQLTSLTGPLSSLSSVSANDTAWRQPTAVTNWGVQTNDENAINWQSDSFDLSMESPSVIRIRLPQGLAQNATFISDVLIDPSAGPNASIQCSVTSGEHRVDHQLRAPGQIPGKTPAVWSGVPTSATFLDPILVMAQSPARTRWERELHVFRELFPPALCYEQIVPVDEVVTLTLFHRDDDHLKQLMLDETESAELDRLWEQLHFVSQDALQSVDAFDQLWQFATQDADPSAFEPLRQPTYQRAELFRQLLIEAQPRHIEAAINFAARVARKPISVDRRRRLLQLYDDLRADGLNHEESIRLLIARAFLSADFLFKLEGGQGDTESRGPFAVRRLTDFELASRLSYFLWSSVPDDDLMQAAAANQLHFPYELQYQIERMLVDPKIQRLATEFFCQWWMVYEFDQHAEKSEATFPEFADLRNSMYEEIIRTVTTILQEGLPTTCFLDADFIIVDQPLAKFYSVEGFELNSTQPWQRIPRSSAMGRGGLLTSAAFLAKQSGASRTSPILRGNWISEVLLGERLPRPPKNVPPLPEFVPAGLTSRELTELHSSTPGCLECHRRIDGFGFALENFDAIGRFVKQQSEDVSADLPDGTKVVGFEELRNYLAYRRQQEFHAQLCRKLLGYSLGRSVQLSDQPLLDKMQAHLKDKEGSLSQLILEIVSSDQFQFVRVDKETLTLPPR
ncbi:MAG: DUF1592 domain-containing protein [Planctomycetales bacterium]|nr:DUF1592 domain-containing protein [Planctomycetales bacterium]